MDGVVLDSGATDSGTSATGLSLDVDETAEGDCQEPCKAAASFDARRRATPHQPALLCTQRELDRLQASPL